MYNLSGLTNINIELTSRCNKNCWICGRRERDRNIKDLQYGDIDLKLVERIAHEENLCNIVVQFHNNGEPLLYPNFGKAVNFFDKDIIKNTVTNGKLLLEKFDEVLLLDTLSISIIPNDPDGEEQDEIIFKFLDKKKDRKPFTSLRLIGDIEEKRVKKLENFKCLMIRRLLHSPKGSFNYQKKNPTIPEIGVCLDFLNHLAIDRFGNISCCVRFDPNKELVLGNLENINISEAWNSEKRLEMKRLHILGKRNEISFCKNCEYWGVPSGLL